MAKPKATKKKPLGTKEFAFFLRSDLRKYRGNYVALVGQKVVASGKNAKQVWEQAAKKHPHSLPTLAKLPKEEVLVLVWT